MIEAENLTIESGKTYENYRGKKRTVLHIIEKSEKTSTYVNYEDEVGYVRKCKVGTFRKWMNEKY